MKQIDLEFEPTKDYYLDHIDRCNKLSELITDCLDYNKGSFFTYLPEDAILNRLYEFQWGGIIPTLKMEGQVRYTRDGKPFTPEFIRTTFDTVISFVRRYLNKNDDAIMIADNFNETIGSPHVNIPNVSMFLYNNEVYYNVNSRNSSTEITQAFNKADILWRSLILLCRNLPPVSGQMNLNELKNIIPHIHFIIVTAYDGEGYLFWQKK